MVKLRSFSCFATAFSVLVPEFPVAIQHKDNRTLRDNVQCFHVTKTTVFDVSQTSDFTWLHCAINKDIH